MSKKHTRKELIAIFKEEYMRRPCYSLLASKPSPDHLVKILTYSVNGALDPKLWECDYLMQLLGDEKLLRITFSTKPLNNDLKEVAAKARIVEKVFGRGLFRYFLTIVDNIMKCDFDNRIQSNDPKERNSLIDDISRVPYESYYNMILNQFASLYCTAHSYFVYNGKYDFPIFDIGAQYILPAFYPDLKRVSDRTMFEYLFKRAKKDFSLDQHDVYDLYKYYRYWYELCNLHGGEIRDYLYNQGIIDDNDYTYLCESQNSIKIMVNP